MTSLVDHERGALCDLLLEVGPDAPTLCVGWSTRDLAAHLVIREGRPDVAGGILIPALAGWTKRAQDKLAARPWPTLVGYVRNGRWPVMPSRWGGVDSAINSIEFFVHHEDVRRARDNWQPRELPDAVNGALWSFLRKRGGLYLRRSPVGVSLRWMDATLVAHAGEQSVTVTGDPAELVLFIHGRGEHAKVHFDGDALAIGELRRMSFGV